VNGTTTDEPRSKISQNKIVEEVQAIFEDKDVSTEVKLAYLHKLHENLNITEKAIGSGFFRIILSFIAFVLLDSGLIDKVSLVGTEIKGTGVLLLLFPLIISFLAYQLINRTSFAHEIRSAIALMYFNLSPTIYKKGLDLLTHYPSSRNIESYHGKLVHGKGLRLLDFSTSVVTILLSLLPFVAVVYCFVQTFQRDDVSTGAWILSFIISGILIFRTIVMEFFSLSGCLMHTLTGINITASIAKQQITRLMQPTQKAARLISSVLLFISIVNKRFSS
jgi:hypothetical protein